MAQPSQIMRYRRRITIDEPRAGAAAILIYPPPFSEYAYTKPQSKIRMTTDELVCGLSSSIQVCGLSSSIQEYFTFNFNEVRNINIPQFS